MTIALDRHKLILKYPSSIWGARWKEALPAGNGETGAAVYGGVYEETVMLTHANLWWQSRTTELPDVSGKLPEIRALIADNRSQEADNILADALKDSGYVPNMGTPLPLGDLKILMHGVNAFTRYRRILDMATGEISVSWQDGGTVYNRHVFVSRPENAVIIEIRKEGPAPINVELWVDRHDLADARSFGNHIADVPENPFSFSKDNFMYYAASSDNGTDFGAAASVELTGGQLKNDPKGIVITGAERVLIKLKLFIEGQRDQDWEHLHGQLIALPEDYDTLLAAHIEDHSRLFEAMTLDLLATGRELSNEELLLEAYQGEAPLALVEKMWSYGRYLLISSSKEGGSPCPLMGLWCGEYAGFWAFNMANENLQMNYWHTLSGNMPELLLSVFDYYERLMDDFRENARKLYGCGGIYIPAPTSPDSGLLKTVAPHIIHWTGAAGWIGQHFYDYYQHTGDVEFLQNRALPFLYETMLFYEDFLLIGEDGKYIYIPSNSPENTPSNIWKKESRYQKEYYMETTINATMDLAIAKEVITHLLEGSRIAGVYGEEWDKWESMLKRFPPYEINEDGAIKEWMHPFYKDNYEHRHQSHIYPVFPGIEVTRQNQPELFEAFVTAVDKRLEVGLKEQSGWSLAHMANNYARMGHGDKALECLGILSRTCLINNFYTLHNDWRGMGVSVDLDWAPFQIDANMGWTAAIQEMLLFSRPGLLSVLPALPARLKEGSAGPLLARGAIQVHLQWDMEEGRITAEFESLHKDQEVELILPDRFQPQDKLSSPSKLFLPKSERVTVVYQNNLIR